MRILELKVESFKRFESLEIRDIPKSAQLVLLVGPNGSGKSSLFDAIANWFRMNSGLAAAIDPEYCGRNADATRWMSGTTIKLADGELPNRYSFYWRTAYRNTPDFAAQQIQKPNVPTAHLQSRRSIDNDEVVSENYRRLIFETMSGIYDPENDRKTISEFRNELIGDIRESMRRVFDDLVLRDIVDPIGGRTFSFDKGTSSDFAYKNLSGGEKSAFDLILDFHLKKDIFANAIFCLDEIETHLHTSVQGRLLQEILRIAPATVQFWVSTHSLGVLRCAQRLEAHRPGSVCVFDFSEVDFDQPCTLRPASVGRVTWSKFLSLALDDLNEQILPKLILVCEGSSVGNRRRDFDAQVYTRIFEANFPDIGFLSGGGSSEIASTVATAQRTVKSFAPGTRLIGLLDRDDRSPEEIAEIESDRIVLRLRNLESYLLADDVLEEFLRVRGQLALRSSVLKLKADCIASSVSRGNAIDDLKSTVGEICVGLKKLVGMVAGGNTSDAFLRDTLAPLIRPGLTTYDQLKADIIDRARTLSS